MKPFVTTEHTDDPRVAVPVGEVPGYGYAFALWRPGGAPQPMCSGSLEAQRSAAQAATRYVHGHEDELAAMLAAHADEEDER